MHLYQQEAASAKMMEKFKSMDEAKNTIKRDGQEMQVVMSKIVPGDL
eukprot:gene472-7214_t